MKAKFVKSFLPEEWVSTDTGIDRYLDNASTRYYRANKSDKKTEEDEDEDSYKENNDEDDIISQYVPSPDVKLTPEDFKMYVDQLINFIYKKDPKLAFHIFVNVIKTHPYISKRPVGFHGENLYKNTIEKFLSLYKV